MTKSIIETHDLTKIYRLRDKSTITALKDINISIKEGEIFGLLGPNGAGKTTLIKVLTTLENPTNGYAVIDGFNIQKSSLKAKAKISLMLGSQMLYYRITAYDNLKFFCKIYKAPSSKKRIYDAAKSFGLEDWLNEYVERFSSGMKMKLALLRTFLLNRPVLFLDEPTLGLDVKFKNEIIKKIKEMNKTVLLTSHDMSVVERLCDNIAFINKGEIIKIGTKEDIKKLEHSEIKFKISLKNRKRELINTLKQKEFITEVEESNKGINISILSREYYSIFLKTISDYSILKLKEYEFSLEDLFIQLNK